MARFYVFDAVIFVFFLSLVISSVFLLSSGNHGALYVEVEAMNEKHYLPLDKNEKLTIEGPIGKTIVTVNDGTAHVSDSDCRDKICISMGEITHSPDWIACLPNRVFVRIVSRGQNKHSEVDASVF